MCAFLYVKVNSRESFEEISFPFRKILVSAFFPRIEFKANYLEKICGYPNNNFSVDSYFSPYKGPLFLHGSNLGQNLCI